MSITVPERRPDVATSGRSSLLAHALLLALVLTVVASLAEPVRAVFDADEGARTLQAEILDETGGWTTPYWAAEWDPDGRWMPVQWSTRFGDEFAPTIARPAFSLLLAGGHRIGGVVGMTALGVVGAVAAAVAAALMARQALPGSELPALWIAGAVSPLAMNAVVLQGHTIAAALTGAGTALSLWAWRDRGRLAVGWVLAAGCFALAALLRRETLIYAVALVIGMAIGGHAAGRGRAAVAGLAAVFGAGAGLAANEMLSARLFDLPQVRSVPASAALGRSGLEGRLDAIWTTVLRPGYAFDPLTELTLLAIATIGAYSAWRYRRSGDVTHLLAGWGTGAVLLLAIALGILGERESIPGLLPAFPLLAWLAPLVPLRSGPTIVRTGAVTTVVFVATVAVTSYSIGGGWEWGARYVAVGMPLAAATLAVTLNVVLAQVPDRRRSFVIAAVLVGCGSMLIVGVGAQRSARGRTADQIATVSAATETIGTDVVVSTEPQLPRSAVDQRRTPVPRWLFVPPAAFGDALDGLGRLPVERFVMVTRDAGAADAVARERGWTYSEVGQLPANPGMWSYGALEREPAG